MPLFVVWTLPRRFAALSLCNMLMLAVLWGGKLVHGILAMGS